MEARGLQGQSCVTHAVHNQCICAHYADPLINHMPTSLVPCKRVTWERLGGLWCTLPTVRCTAQSKPFGPGLFILLLQVVCDCVWCVAGLQGVCAGHTSGVDPALSQQVGLGLAFQLPAHSRQAWSKSCIMQCSPATLQAHTANSMQCFVGLGLTHG
jgi:hypothetical protein